jgi:hypothetical protein
MKMHRSALQAISGSGHREVISFWLLSLVTSAVTARCDGMYVMLEPGRERRES